MDQIVKTNIYVDGFNLYYGSLRGTPHRWLDLSRLCRLLLPRDRINRIRYFTALVEARTNDPSKPQRQQAYLRALETLPEISIHYGRFLSHTVRMPYAHPRPNGPQTVEVVKTEEKGTDVSLATNLLIDAFNDDCEMVVLISNDSDLRDPLDYVRRQLGKRVVIFNPHKNRSWPLSQVSDLYRPIRKGPLSASQFPHQLTDSQGTITKPPTW